MSDLVWVKSSGVEVTTNDLPATVAKAKELGWKPKEEVKEEVVVEIKKKKGK